MKRALFKTMVCAGLTGTLFTLGSCDDSKDLYNPYTVQEAARAAFPVKNIDPYHTWETSKVCKATVSVNENSGETYTIYVLTGNPYNKDNKPSLLATATMRDGETKVFNFDAPEAMRSAYVMKKNSKGHSAAIPAQVKGGIMEACFSGEIAQTRSAAMTRATFFTAEVPNSNYFPTTAPSNCGDINKYPEKLDAIPYLLKDATYSNLNPYVGGDIYIKGNVTIESWSEPSSAKWGQLADGNWGSIPITTNFYLLPNSRLTFNISQFNHRPNSVFSIGENATLIANGTLKGEAGSKYYNKGTVNANNIEITNAYLYNDGELSASTLLLTNADSKVCNASNGSMVLDLLKIEGNGNFLNETDGNVTVGETILNCTNGSWENSGHYTNKGDMKISAWNSNVKNSCWLTVEKLFSLSDGGIINDNYIYCSSLYMNNGTVTMSGGSFFKVDGTAEFGYNTTGFIAESEQALLKMNKAIATSAGQGYTITYNGNLYVDCTSHFEGGYSGSYPIIDMKNGAAFLGSSNFSLPQSACSPGYNLQNNDDDDDDEDYSPQIYTYAFEDLAQHVGDYDFNDVVLYVTVPYDKEDGKKYIDVTLKAVGASKSAVVYLNNDKVFSDELHKVMGSSIGHLINTGVGSEDSFVDCKEVTETIEVDSNFSLTKDGNFYIKSDDEKRTIYIPEFDPEFASLQLTGAYVPYAIRIPSAWLWPTERTIITDAYPGFETWAGNAQEEPTWYDDYTEGKVYK